MTKPKIIQHLREMLRIAEQDNDEFLAEHRKKYPNIKCERAYPLKLGIITAKIESVLMYLEAEMEEGERYGKQAEDLRQAVGDAEADEARS